MPNITLSIPKDIHKKMKIFSDIKWSEVARRSIEERIRDLETMNKLASKSKLTKKDVEEITKKIKSRMAKTFYEYNND